MRLAFPCIVVKDRDTFEVRDGSLFSLPPELSDKFRISRYASIETSGWSTTEFGYMALAREDAGGYRYVLPGLFLLDAPAPKKKFIGYRPQFTKAQVEGYLAKHFAWEEEVRKRLEEELSALVHYLRHLSSSIYHSAIEADEAATSGDRRAIQEGIRTIIAAQTMLKVRIDYLDFANSIDRFEDRENIPVFRRVDKVIRCFRASAKHKGIDIQLSGSSYNNAYGPNILDIIPYTLIDNAIKYAPKYTEILVHVTDTDQDTTVRITSVGPAIGPDELNAIFERGRRGRNAIAAGRSGTGLGLSVARDVVSEFKGRLDVSQGESSTPRDGIPYKNVTFKFQLPSRTDALQTTTMRKYIKQT